MNSQSTKSIANGQMASQEERKIAGRFRQCIIMFWKNSLLFRRNVWGTLAELLMAFLFCLIILLLRFFIDLTVFPDQSSVNTTSTSILSYNPVLSPFNLVNSSNRTQIYYYPNNSFILGLVTNAYTLINAVKPSFNATCKIKNASKFSFKLHVLLLFNVYSGWLKCKRYITANGYGVQQYDCFYFI